jgi:hypothetical protein
VKRPGYLRGRRARKSTASANVNAANASHQSRRRLPGRAVTTPSYPGFPDHQYILVLQDEQIPRSLLATATDALPFGDAQSIGYPTVTQLAISNLPFLPLPLDASSSSPAADFSAVPETAQTCMLITASSKKCKSSKKFRKAIRAQTYLPITGRTKAKG